MDRPYTILVADHNFHVRAFLRRELSALHYRIREAGNHLQLFASFYDEPHIPDLIILDPYIPYISGIAVLTRLQEITPPVPVILYTHMTEYRNHPVVQKAAGLVEKNGDTRLLQETIARVLHSHYASGDGSSRQTGVHGDARV